MPLTYLNIYFRPKVTGLRVDFSDGRRSAMKVSARPTAAHSALLKRCSMLSGLQREDAASKAALSRTSALTVPGSLRVRQAARLARRGGAHKDDRQTHPAQDRLLVQCRPPLLENVLGWGL